jgi:hypothetical protein
MYHMQRDRAHRGGGYVTLNIEAIKRDRYRIINDFSDGDIVSHQAANALNALIIRIENGEYEVKA